MYISSLEKAEFTALVKEAAKEAVKEILLCEKDLLSKIVETPLTRHSTVPEVCAHFRITKPTLYNWLKKGMLKKYKHGGRTTFIISEIQESMRTIPLAFGKGRDYGYKIE